MVIIVIVCSSLYLLMLGFIIANYKDTIKHLEDFNEDLSLLHKQVVEKDNELSKRITQLENENKELKKKSRK